MRRDSTFRLSSPYVMLLIVLASMGFVYANQPAINKSPPSLYRVSWIQYIFVSWTIAGLVIEYDRSVLKMYVVHVSGHRFLLRF